jgi:hypothetical protein
MERRGRRGIRGDERGTVLVETALGVACVLTVALPFASLIDYAASSSRDLAAVHAAARDASRTRSLATGGVAYRCGVSAGAVDGPCVAPLARGTYVAATKDTTVTLAFGVVLHTNARAVGRVG